ncbi:MAG: PepSY-associated TM helix domain-containing protein [Candidatus Binatia bacterium]
MNTIHQREKPRGGFLFLPRRLTRNGFLKWLRRTHAWFGLWGAAFGLLFGITGFLLNHRAVLQIPAAQLHESREPLALPTPLPANPQALATFLQRELRIARAPTIKVEKSRPAPWGDGSVHQPEHWQIHFTTPKVTISAEYWAGNTSVSVKRLEANLFAFLTRLHKASGTGIAWTLLADTFAGGIIVLALTGILLWTRLHGPRLLAAGLGFGSFVLAVIFVLRTM